MAQQRSVPGAMRTRALIIGVNDYTRLEGGLKGAVADAMHWYGIARRMGIPGEDITVLTSPALDAAAFGGDDEAKASTYGLADRTGILEAARALAARMDVAGGAKAMVTFSGHGGWDEARGALLAPCDAAADLGDALALAELEAALDGRAPETDVTFFVDACYRHGAAGDGKDAGAELPRLGRGDVLFSAAPPRQPSHELFVGGEWRGAFSWAVTSILDRWGVRNAGVDPDFNLDYATLRDRAAELLRAMAVVQPPQVATLAAPRAVFARRGTGADDRPSLALGVREIPPETGFRVKRTNGTEIGVLSTTTSQQTWTWYLDKGSAFPAEDFVLHENTNTTPEAGHTLSTMTFENGSGFSGGSASLSGAHYEVAGGSITACVKYDVGNDKLNWVSSGTTALQGSTITFTYKTSGSPSGAYSETDERI